MSLITSKKLIARAAPFFAAVILGSLLSGCSESTMTAASAKRVTAPAPVNGEATPAPSNPVIPSAPVETEGEGIPIPVDPEDSSSPTSTSTPTPPVLGAGEGASSGKSPSGETLTSGEGNGSGKAPSGETLTSGSGSSSGQKPKETLDEGSGAKPLDIKISPTITFKGGAYTKQSTSAPTKGGGYLDFLVTRTYGNWTLVRVSGKTLSSDFKIASYTGGPHQATPGSVLTNHTARVGLFFKWVDPAYVVYKGQVFSFHFKNSVTNNIVSVDATISLCTFRVGTVCNFTNPATVVQGAAGHSSSRGSL